MTPSSPSSPASRPADQGGREAVLARSWCRVDLAGGTLDIWPLGLLHPGAVTVNLAVDLPVTCRVAAPPGAGESRYRIELGGKGETGDGGHAGTSASAELQDEAPEEEALEALEAENLSDLLSDPATSLPALVLDILGMPPVTLTLTSASPRGGGLGASSALAVAMIAACEAWLGRDAVGEGAEADDPVATAARRTALARDIEARLMSLPTGTQDHWPGQLGGALALGHRPGGTDVRRIDTDLEALGASLLVAYSGVSHFSAGQNWQVVRRRLDGEEEATRLFAGIARVAAAAEEALAAGDLPRLGALVREEWSLRRQLAPGVSVPEVEAILDAATAAGAWGGKACGAGGGGCVAVLCPPRGRGEVVDAWTGLGVEILAAAPTARSLELVRPG